MPVTQQETEQSGVYDDGNMVVANVMVMGKERDIM